MDNKWVSIYARHHKKKTKWTECLNVKKSKNYLQLSISVQESWLLGWVLASERSSPTNASLWILHFLFPRPTRASLFRESFQVRSFPSAGHPSVSPSTCASLQQLPSLSSSTQSFSPNPRTLVGVGLWRGAYPTTSWPALANCRQFGIVFLCELHYLVPTIQYLPGDPLCLAQFSQLLLLYQWFQPQLRAAFTPFGQLCATHFSFESLDLATRL